MNKFILAILLIISSFSYGNSSSDIEVLPIEDLSFQKVAVSELNKEEIRAKGYLLIRLKDSSISIKDYIPRLLAITYPKTATLSNNNKFLRVENINLNLAVGNTREIVDDSFKPYRGFNVIFQGSPLKLEVSGIIDKKDINSQLENVEGEYFGVLPLEINQYIKEED